MNVIAFPQRERAICRTWHHVELQKLVALYSAHAASGAVDGWEVGATEAQDPQFYVTSASSDGGLMLCISRVGRIYVLEDERGALLAENQQLEPIIERASRVLSRRKIAGLLVRSLFALCALRVVIEQKLEPFMAESTENWAHFAPYLASFV